MTRCYMKNYNSCFCHFTFSKSRLIAMVNKRRENKRLTQLSVFHRKFQTVQNNRNQCHGTELYILSGNRTNLDGALLVVVQPGIHQPA